MSKPTNHTEYKDLLDKIRVEGKITAPPRQFIAILTKKGSPESFSIQFQEWANGIEAQTTDTVILKLLSQYLKMELANGEISESTLEYKIGEEFTNENHRIVIPGSQLRYVLKKDKPARSKTTYVPGNTPWKFLTDEVSIQVLAGSPFAMDEDPYTLEQNKKEIKKLISDQIKEEEEKLKRGTLRIAGLKRLIKDIS